jgi:hypothetical protein
MPTHQLVGLRARPTNPDGERDRQRPHGRIPWVVVGMHEYCLSLVKPSRFVSDDIMNLLSRRSTPISGTRPCLFAERSSHWVPAVPRSRAHALTPPVSPTPTIVQLHRGEAR